MIDLKTYKQARNLFNNYLLSKANIYSLSNPVLSIINEHSRHTNILKKKFSSNSLIIFLKFYFFSLPFLVLFFFIKKFFSKKLKINFKSNTLVFSHLIDQNFLNKNKDYIFW